MSDFVVKRKDMYKSFVRGVAEMSTTIVDPDQFWKVHREQSLRSNEILKSILEEHRMYLDVMERFCQYVINLGYDSNDCMIQNCEIRPFSFDHGGEEIHRLLVHDEPCFEVRVTHTPMVDLKWTMKIESKILKFPSPCAPGTAQSPMIGDPET